MSSEQIYDDYWKSGHHVTQEWTPEFFQQTLGVLVGKKRVLDYGCGLGYSYQRPLSASVTEYIAADISSEAVGNAESKGFKAVPIADNSRVGLDSDFFDGVVCSEVMEHLWDPLAAARELHRVLEPGGVLVVTVPNFGYLPWRLMALLRAQVPLEPETSANRYKGVHIRFYSKLMLSRLLKDAGFREVVVYGWCGSSIWHAFWATGPGWKIANLADKYLPQFLHLPFLGKIWPGVFAERLRAVAVK